MKPTVLLTGASSGIGRATARLLAARGYRVYGAARHTETMEDLRRAGVIPLSMDLTDERSMDEGVRRILGREGRIDILINNAGFGFYGTVEDVPLGEARRQMEVNLFGPARLIQLVLPGMRAQRSGRIVNISSIGGKMATPLGGWYHASKFALEGLNDSLRLEVSSLGIDVVLIEPGGIQTQWAPTALENLRKSASGSAYGPLIARMARWLETFGQRSSDPEVIAFLIARVLTLRRPRARYSRGYMARLTLWGRRWLGDRLFDRLLLRQLDIKS